MTQEIEFPAGRVTGTSAIVDYVQDGVLHVSATTRSVCVASRADLASLPKEYPPGSVAFTAGFKELWQLDATGAWVDMIGGGE